MKKKFNPNEFILNNLDKESKKRWEAGEMLYEEVPINIREALDEIMNTLRTKEVERKKAKKEKREKIPEMTQELFDEIRNTALNMFNSSNKMKYSFSYWIAVVINNKFKNKNKKIRDIIKNEYYKYARFHHHTNRKTDWKSLAANDDTNKD